jgi:hypothetical protein
MPPTYIDGWVGEYTHGQHVIDQEHVDDWVGISSVFPVDLRRRFVFLSRWLVRRYAFALCFSPQDELRVCFELFLRFFVFVT